MAFSNDLGFCRNYYSWYLFFINRKENKEMKLQLLTQNLEDQLRVAKLLNSITEKIVNKENISDGIILSFEETQLIQNIVVSVGKGGKQNVLHD